MCYDLEIKQHIEKLSWRYSLSEQECAIAVLSGVSAQYAEQIFDKERKDTWENAVKVIQNWGFPKNKEVLPDLLWLLKDVNWPGARNAINILSTVDKTIIIPMMREMLRLADADEDTMWIGGIKMLVEEAGLSYEDLNDNSIYEILRKSDF